MFISYELFIIDHFDDGRYTLLWCERVDGFGGFRIRIVSDADDVFFFLLLHIIAHTYMYTSQSAKCLSHILWHSRKRKKKNTHTHTYLARSKSGGRYMHYVCVLACLYKRVVS